MIIMNKKDLEQMKAELKAELKVELQAELLTLLNSKAGYFVRLLPNSQGLYYVVRYDESGHEINKFQGNPGNEWLFAGAVEIVQQLTAATKDGVLQPGTKIHTNHYRGYVEPATTKPTYNFGT